MAEYATVLGVLIIAVAATIGVFSIGIDAKLQNDLTTILSRHVTARGARRYRRPFRRSMIARGRADATLVSTHDEAAAAHEPRRGPPAGRGPRAARTRCWRCPCC